MQGRPSCLLQSAGGETNRILLASALSSMRIICPNRVSRHDWIIAVSLGSKWTWQVTRGVESMCAGDLQQRGHFEGCCRTYVSL